MGMNQEDTNEGGAPHNYNQNRGRENMVTQCHM